MTENKPIMIDGVDVSKCEHNHDRKLGEYSACNLYPPPLNCKHHPNCLFKQLARKTQECKDLKSLLKKSNRTLQGTMHDRDTAYQKLEQIRKIANGMHDMWINKTRYTDIFNLAEHLLKCELNRIINEFDEIDEGE